MKKISLNKKRKFKDRIRTFFNNVFSSSKKTILYTSLLLLAIVSVYLIFILIFRDNFYNNFSDDSLQYYPIMIDFIDSIKSGDIGFYNVKNYLGSSVFGDAYYVPLDFFTLVIFLLSYLMPTEIAMSFTELLKMVLSSTILMVYLSRIKSKPKTMHMIGMMYFASSGMTCFSAFPSFTSLSFYLPLSLVVIDSFINKKNWFFVPLFSMAVVFYNFYLAYTLFAFMAFAGLIIIGKRKDGFIKFVLKEVALVLLIIFGLLMAMCIFYPSVLFILNSTSRTIANDGSLMSMILMVKAFFELIAEGIKGLVSIPINIIKDGGSFFNTNAFSDSFIVFNDLINTFSSKFVMDGVTVNALFFNTEEYFRIMSTTYTPLTPTCFYGYQQSYFIEHISLYITGLGLILSSSIFSMKGRIPRIYKIMIIVMMVFMSLPFFSYIFSGDLNTLYTRWINTLSIPLLIVSSYVLDNTKEFKAKKLIAPVSMVIFFGLFSMTHHFVKLTSIAEDNSFSENFIEYSNVLFYTTLLMFVVFTIGFILLSKYKEKKNKFILGLSILSGVVLLGLLIYGIVNTVNVLNEGITTSFKSKPLYSYENLFGFEYLTLLILFFVVVEVFALTNKKKVLLSIFLGIEILISCSLAFGTSVILSGRETTFKNCRNLKEFISENISEDELSRVYIDSSISDLLSNNVSRLLGVGTNQTIFHSFIYSETDDVAKILTGKSSEGQASKSALNTYSYYLAQVMGYKYVCESATNIGGYSSKYEIICENEDYRIYQFSDYEEFISYDSYMSFDSFTSKSSSLSDISKAKYLIDYCAIDEGDLELVESYLGDASDTIFTDSAKQSSILSKKYMEYENRKVKEIDGKYYYEYNFTGLDDITTRSYAINVFNISGDVDELVSEGKIYLELENGTKVTPSLTSMNGSKLHIPVYGDSSKSTKAKALYVYAGEEEPQVAPIFSYTVEAIFPNINNIESYENGGSAGSGLGAYIRFSVDSELDSTYKIGIYNGTKEVSISNIILELEDHTFVSSSKTISTDKKIINIYILKGSDVVSLTNPPILKLIEYEETNYYSDNYTSKSVNYNSNKLSISYTKEASSGYNIIMIPYAYSNEFKVVKGDVKNIISVDGGFIGLIVDSSIEENNIVLEFEPNGLELGLKISLISISAYLFFMLEYILNKKRRGYLLWIL